MSLQIVNGYPCANCADVAQAKRGIDPSHKIADTPGLEKETQTPNVQKPDATNEARAALAFTQNLDQLA